MGARLGAGGAGARLGQGSGGQIGDGDQGAGLGWGSVRSDWGPGESPKWNSSLLDFIFILFKII